MTPADPSELLLREAVAAEFIEFADVLADLPAEVWDRPSLCKGWRVREVIAHMTMPCRYSVPRILIELAKARGNFNKMADRSARRDSAMPIDDQLAVLRSDKLHAWKPPGGGYEGALIHAVVHGLDVTIPLGADRQIPQERMRIVMDGITKPASLKHFGLDIDGLHFRADDIAWEFGSGDLVSGPARDLALMLCGRRPLSMRR